MQYIGNNQITAKYVGNTEVQKQYVGDTLIWENTPPTPPQHDYSQDYLTFKITSDGMINWFNAGQEQPKTIQYSKDNGVNWTSITSTTEGTQIQVTTGDVVLFKGNYSKYASGFQNYNSFQGTSAGFEVCGNIMSLISGDSFTSATTFNDIYVFDSLFKSCSGLTSAENLILPVTALTNGCYDNMFIGSRALTTAPELPAPTLADYCYQYMFSGCTSLNYIKCLATSIGYSSTTHWVRGVQTTSGTFVKAKTMEGWSRGNAGIPNN